MAALELFNLADENHSDEENIDPKPKRKILWVVKDFSNPLEGLSHEKVKEFFRFNVETLHELAVELTPALRRLTKRLSALPALMQVLIAIRFYTCGAYYHVIGSTGNLSKSSVCRSVHAVAQALTGLTR